VAAIGGRAADADANLRGLQVPPKQPLIRQDPCSGPVFMLRLKRTDRVTLLVYDGTGLVLF
jgi:hypothetical protein